MSARTSNTLALLIALCCFLLAWMLLITHQSRPYEPATRDGQIRQPATLQEQYAVTSTTEELTMKPIPYTPKPLTPEETRVIKHKGTEAPFSGAYWKTKTDGTYACRQCGAALFSSTAKFDSQTGWPSFDTALPGAVKEIPDADGHRTEIVCAKCGGHLGHVFRGEGMTAKDTRHCVNSTSLAFCPLAENQLEQKQASTSATESSSSSMSATASETKSKPMPNAPPPRAPTEEAIFAGGCFWGVEYHFEKEPGVIDVTSGYTGGIKEHPTYEDVCSGTTGHAEAVRVRYDPQKTNFEKLARLFFNIHDPTQRNRQGPDIGSQYRSAVFYHTAEEKETVGRLIEQLKQKGYNAVTTIEPAGKFWPAESYHQNYYAKTGRQPYCHVWEERLAPSAEP